MSTLSPFRPDPLLQRLSDWFDEPLGRWSRTRMEHFIRVEETMTDGSLVIRAELPGVDPESDIDIDVANGTLTISAEREESSTGGDGHFSEFRYGTFRRTLRVPSDLDPASISAEYHHGILTVTVPIPAPAAPEAVKIPIATT